MGWGLGTYCALLQFRKIFLKYIAKRLSVYISRAFSELGVSSNLEKGIRIRQYCRL